MRHLLPRPPTQITKRGQVLIILGLIWLAIGANIFIEPNPPGWHTIWIFTEPPPALRAGAWIITGFVAMAYALRPTWVTHDGIGFLALYIMPAERAVGFFYGWLANLCPPVDIFGWFTLFGGDGYPRGLLSGLVYLVIIALIIVISRWDDPLPRTPGGVR